MTIRDQNGQSDQRRVIVHATNVHQGGGGALLKELLSAPNGPDLAFLDERMRLPEPLAPKLKVTRVSPNLRQRWEAEAVLARTCQEDDIVLCFGNLPPLRRCRGHVFVYLQNRYLVAPRRLTGLPWKAQARLRLERWWLRACLRNATLVVQTETMAEEVHQHLSRNSLVLPFMPPQPRVARPAGVRHDYIYVASGEPHKNHRCLVAAWEILARNGLHPSLCLTLNKSTDAGLVEWISQRQSQAGLRIRFETSGPDGMASLYAQSGALIYPSLFESFGLPLLEARAAGLSIVASERDYVRDVVEPEFSFDPASPLSLARAVMRHLDPDRQPRSVPDATGFWQQLRGMS